MTERDYNKFVKKFTVDDLTGCWNWQASKMNSGYGQFRIGNKMVGAHRVSYEHHKGEIKEKHVLHQCDNKGCVNPDHLFLGTNQDNVNDKISKGRQSRGEGHGRSSLTNEEVQEIIALLPVMSNTNIAKRYNVGHKCISKIRTGKRWKHLTSLDNKEDKNA